VRLLRNRLSTAAKAQPYSASLSRHASPPNAETTVEAAGGRFRRLPRLGLRLARGCRLGSPGGGRLCLRRCLWSSLAPVLRSEQIAEEATNPARARRRGDRNPVRDLLLCAKHLFFAARVLVFTMLQPLDAVPISPCLACSALPLSIYSPRFLVQLGVKKRKGNHQR
jgi:hypothetical protein